MRSWSRCMGLTGFFDSDIPEEQGIEVLRKALELGVTTFNTAVRTCARCEQAKGAVWWRGYALSTVSLNL